ncbi:MAG: RNA polymerase sigma factor [Planctomycetia bacterium]|nr:RNA polymerase sigma factor [Planctomycetia bacterium]
MPSADDVRIDPALVASLYLKHADEIRYFLLGVLRDVDLAGEAMQAAFAKAVEVGHTVQEESLKAWLFRVAYNEALAMRRRQAVGERVLQQIAWESAGEEPSAASRSSRWETVTAVRAALESLPPEQRQVVRMRMYEQKKFAEIAKELGLPLGTVLTRMQLAIKKLKPALGKLAEDDK